MPNCLGICIEKNLIKYAKLTADKDGKVEIPTAYGVKFYENAALPIIQEIIQETDSLSTPVSVKLSKEEYTSFEVFSRIKDKEMREMINTEFGSYCAEKGFPESVVDMRFILVKNTGKQDAYKAICVSANKTELSNLWQSFSNAKIASIAPIGLSIANLLKNKGLTENSVVVNIEDRTTITVFTKGEIAKVVVLSVGMAEVLDKLYEKYNSYAKAYEACKKVSAYIDESSQMEISEEDSDILDILLPVFYDIRDRVAVEVEEFRSDVSQIYLTGTATIVNNLDIYFQDFLTDKKCELLKPFFVTTDMSGIKDLTEVNSAIAIALNGLGYADKNTDFYTMNADGFLGMDIIKKKINEIAQMDVKSAIGDWFNNLKQNGIKKPDVNPIKTGPNLIDKLKANVNAKKKPKVEVDYADNNEPIVSPDDYFGGDDDGEGTPNAPAAREHKNILADGSGFTPMDMWLVRLAAAMFVGVLIYGGTVYYTEAMTQEKIEDADKNILKTNASISSMKKDTDFVLLQAADYKTKTEKLSAIITKIQNRELRTYNIPNFLSQLMFIVPTDVKVTSIVAEEGSKVVLQAESGKYAQLGYLVSRIKVENILTEVDMQVVGMEGNIKIKVGGVLP